MTEYTISKCTNVHCTISYNQPVKHNTVRDVWYWPPNMMHNNKLQHSIDISWYW